jgi:hypothetical protein
MSDAGVPPPEGTKKGFQLGKKEKTILSVVIGLVAIGIGVNSSIQYEARYDTGPVTTHPPPTYTGSAPLAVDSLQEARETNNDLILVFTAGKDDALNGSVLDTTVAAGNKIRSTDGIYVGVFTLPKNESLDYPTVFLRLMNRGDSSLYQITLRSEITLDKIYDAYLARKFLRNP